jgi:IS66 Orf2 like protein
MITVLRKSRIWLCRHQVDFRRQHDGLLAEAYRVNLDPFAGDVVIFIGRNRRALKVLYADPTGLWVSTKKFTMEAMKTKFAFLIDPSCEAITSAELAMLLEGSSYTLTKKVAVYTHPAVDRRESPDQNRSSNGWVASAERNLQNGTG